MYHLLIKFKNEYENSYEKLLYILNHDNIIFNACIQYDDVFFKKHIIITSLLFSDLGIKKCINEKINTCEYVEKWICVKELSKNVNI